jgi:hemoglobin
MSRVLSIVCLFAVMTASAAVAQEAKKSSPSLYDRLGGAYPVAVVVDAFIERLLVNQTLNANRRSIRRGNKCPSRDSSSTSRRSCARPPAAPAAMPVAR